MKLYRLLLETRQNVTSFLSLFVLYSNLSVICLTAGVFLFCWMMGCQFSNTLFHIPVNSCSRHPTFPSVNKPLSCLTLFLHFLSFRRHKWGFRRRRYYFLPSGCHLTKAVPCLMRSVAGLLPRKPKFFPRQSVWYLWWTKWHWDRCHSECCSTPCL